MSKTPPATVSISMPPRMVKKLQLAAKGRDMTVSEFIRSLIRDGLETKTKTK